MTRKWLTHEDIQGDYQAPLQNVFFSKMGFSNRRCLQPHIRTAKRPCNQEFVVIADYRKRSARLGTTWKYVPIEVLPLAYVPIKLKIEVPLFPCRQSL